MKLTVTSGKGGVGKSLIASAIALNLSKKYKTILFDADAECPNDHLILEIKMRKILDVYKFYPIIDKRKCRKCGVCAKTCKFNAIFFVPGEYPKIIKENCIGCGACKLFCPFNAIKEGKEKVGEILEGDLKKLKVLSARAKVGIEETSLVIKKGKSILQTKKADVYITDTEAGTHCPTINALMGNEKALIVVEPTKFGIHDFLKILKLTRELKIEALALINKSDIGNKRKVYELCRKKKVEIIGEIPFMKELINPTRKSVKRIKIFREIAERLIP